MGLMIVVPEVNGGECIDVSGVEVRWVVYSRQEEA